MTPAEHVARNRGALVETTLDLLAFDTRNPPGETDDIVSYLESELDAAGLATRRVTVEDAGPGLVAWFPDQPTPELLFNGHLDTVGFDRDAWSHSPLGERESETVYGRGATDMKGAVAAMAAVARAYAETDHEPATPVAFAFVSDEEVGGEMLSAATAALPSEPDYCVVGEMTGTTERPSVSVADKGSLWLTLSASGRAAHGSRPMLGENAIDRLYGAVEAIRESLGTVAFDLHPDVEALLPQSVDYYAPTVGEAPARTMFERPTVNLGRLSGGESVNSVPTAATAAVDVRLTASVSPGPILDRVRAVLADRPGVELASVESSEGSYEPPDAPLVGAVVDAASAVTGERVLRRSATGGGDAKALRAAGVSTVEFALGTETAHAVDEHTTVAALEGTARVYARLPAALAGNAVTSG